MAADESLSTSSTCNVLPLLSDEILLAVFSFFVSSPQQHYYDHHHRPCYSRGEQQQEEENDDDDHDGCHDRDHNHISGYYSIRDSISDDPSFSLIDGSSLLATMLVCRRFQKLAYSCHLWKIPVVGSRTTTSTTRITSITNRTTAGQGFSSCCWSSLSLSLSSSSSSSSSLLSGDDDDDNHGDDPVPVDSFVPIRSTFRLMDIITTDTMNTRTSTRTTRSTATMTAAMTTEEDQQQEQQGGSQCDHNNNNNSQDAGLLVSPSSSQNPAPTMTTRRTQARECLLGFTKIKTLSVGDDYHMYRVRDRCTGIVVDLLLRDVTTGSTLNVEDIQQMYAKHFHYNNMNQNNEVSIEQDDGDGDVLVPMGCTYTHKRMAIWYPATVENEGGSLRKTRTNTSTTTTNDDEDKDNRHDMITVAGNNSVNNSSVNNNNKRQRRSSPSVSCRGGISRVSRDRDDLQQLRRHLRYQDSSNKEDKDDGKYEQTGLPLSSRRYTLDPSFLPLSSLSSSSSSPSSFSTGLRHLLHLEEKCRAYHYRLSPVNFKDSNYNNDSSDGVDDQLYMISPLIWARLVDWMLEIVEVCDLNVSVAFRAMSYLQYFRTRHSYLLSMAYYYYYYVANNKNKNNKEKSHKKNKTNQTKKKKKKSIVRWSKNTIQVQAGACLFLASLFERCDMRQRFLSSSCCEMTTTTPTSHATTTTIHNNNNNDNNNYRSNNNNNFTMQNLLLCSDNKYTMRQFNYWILRIFFSCCRTDHQLSEPTILDFVQQYINIIITASSARNNSTQQDDNDNHNDTHNSVIMRQGDGVVDIENNQNNQNTHNIGEEDDNVNGGGVGGSFFFRQSMIMRYLSELALQAYPSITVRSRAGNHNHHNNRRQQQQQQGHRHHAPSVVAAAIVVMGLRMHNNNNDDGGGGNMDIHDNSERSSGLESSRNDNSANGRNQDQDDDRWPATLQLATGITWDNGLSECLQDMMISINAISTMSTPELVMIKRRYQESHRGCVSMIPIPTGL